jgi:hypothetical protein
MPGLRLAGQVFCAILTGVCLFQLSLALGPPLGAYAMGGAFPGRYCQVKATIRVRGEFFVSQAGSRLRVPTDSVDFSRSESLRVWPEIALAKLT